MTPAANPGSKSSSVAEDPAEDGYNKRATLIFLAAVGGTLLLTGATGTLLLRRANASANIVLASAKVANDSAPLRLTDHARGLRYKSKTRTLKDLFKISIVEPEKASIDFRTNRHISDSVNSVARPLNLVDTKETGDVSPEDVSSAVVDGVKALAIATTIVVGTAGTTVFVLAKRMGVSDVCIVNSEAVSGLPSDKAKCTHSHNLLLTGFVTCTSDPLPDLWRCTFHSQSPTN